MRMIGWLTNGRLAAMLCATVMIWGAVAAEAACTRRPGIAIVTAAAIGNYNPFTAAPSVTAAVSITNRGTLVCSISLTFQRATLPAAMTLAAPASSLPYTVQSGGNTVMSVTGVQPAANQEIVLASVAAGATVTQTVTVAPTAGVLVASGSYADNTLNAVVFDSTNFARQRTLAFPVTANVIDVCNLPAPAVASLNFSPAISNGIPNAASIQTDSIVNAQCTAPTRVELSGNSLQTAPLGTAHPGFDNFINWTATATLGSATATLTTTGLTATPAVTSAAKNTATAGTITGTIAIGNVHLIAGNPILAGAYSSTLTIQIDPSL